MNDSFNWYHKEIPCTKKGVTPANILITTRNNNIRKVEVGKLLPHCLIGEDKNGYPIGHIVRSQAKAIEKSSDSFSVVAPLCALADALTKVFMLSGDAQHPCISKYQAQAFQLSV
jgi:hypothetical protein